LILPSGIRASYERRLFACKRGWSATSDLAFVAEALISAHLHRQPNPPWLTETAVTLILKPQTKTHAKRALERHTHWMRFEAVRSAKEHGLRWLQAQVEHAPKLIAKLQLIAKRRKEKPDWERIEAVKKWAKEAEGRADEILKLGRVTWDDAYALAAEALDRTRAKGDPGTMRKSYERVKRDLKSGRSALYLLPKVPRTTLAEALKKTTKELKRRAKVERRAKVRSKPWGVP
jgi:hypothetical protein